MKSATLVVCVFSLAVSGQTLKQAADLYEHTDYTAALQVLHALESPGAEAYELMGKSSLMQGDFKKATEYFQKAVAMAPGNADYIMWLGKSWGRRAEMASPLVAPINAAHARDCFEKAVALDPKNRDALGDLFDYYLHAPGFLGGGLDKAEATARHIQEIDPPEGHFLLAQVACKRNETGEVEKQLRIAVKLGPAQVGHVIALARFLAQQGRIKESDATLAQAERLAPHSPRLIFERASIYVETHRNPEQARELLREYLQCNLTPDDPPREAAEKLLKRVSGA
jgi:tetratricopeptide (TPR) repeat protein